MKNLTVAIILSCLFNVSTSSSFAMTKKTESCDISIDGNQFVSSNLKRVDGEDCKFQLEAGTRHRLVICNLNKTPAEFESHDLKIEKIIKGGSSVKVRLMPLKKGKTYKFEEEFNEVHCAFEAI